MPALPPERFSNDRSGRAQRPPGRAKPEDRRARPGQPACPPPGPARPLPDPAVVQMFLVPDSAPPYDDEAPATGGSPARAPVADGSAAGPPASPREARDDRPETPASPREARDDRPETSASPREGRDDRPETRPLDGGPGEPWPRWPSHFAQVLAETLAGARPARQMAPWATEQVREHIQRLGAQLATGQRPRVRRVITCCPAPDALEMTVVIGIGPRVRALAVRLERVRPGPAGPARPGTAPGWRCTAVEAA